MPRKKNVAQIEERKEIAMAKTTQAETTAQTNRKFNVWDNTYRKLVKAFIDNNEATEFTFTSKYMDDKDFKAKDGTEVHIDGVRKVINFLFKAGALKMVKYEVIVDENGKEIYQIYIKDFNVKTEVDGKFGKYKIFAKAYGQISLAA